MLTLDVRHPDLVDFITAKNDRTKVTGANISVKISDEFMLAVQQNRYFTLRFPIDLDLISLGKVYEDLSYQLLENPSKVENTLHKVGTNKFVKFVKAKDIWDQIIYSAWKDAEPGVIFWDTAKRESIPDCYGPKWENVSTNPCSEILLNRGDSCRLIALNLFGFVNNPFSKNAYFDFKKYCQVVEQGQRLMDDMIDLEIEKIHRIIKKITQSDEPNYTKQPEIAVWKDILDKAEQGRRTGLGITALGDTLAALNIKYGSDAGIQLTNTIYELLAIHSYKSSIQLAEERGSFPIWNHSLEKDNPFIKRVIHNDKFPEEYRKLYEKVGRRNIAQLTTAPTGSLSIQTQTTSGIEPLFSAYYLRRKKVNPNDKDIKVDFIDELEDSWQEYPVFHPRFMQWIQIYLAEHDDHRWSLLDPIELKNILESYSKEELEYLYKQSPWYGCTAMDIKPEKHIGIQSAAQKWVDHSISKTCNLPSEATEEDVSKVYMMAYEQGIKGFTVYRDGSRSGVLVTDSKKPKIQFKPTDAPKRPEELACDIHLVKRRNIDWVILVGLLEGFPYEVFVFRGNGYVKDIQDVTEGKLIKQKIDGKSKYNLIWKNGELLDIQSKFQKGDEEINGRFASLALRHGAGAQYIVESVLDPTIKGIGDFYAVLKSILMKYVPQDKQLEYMLQGCTEGGGCSPIFQDGCVKCATCGNTKCG